MCAEQGPPSTQSGELARKRQPIINRNQDHFDPRVRVDLAVEGPHRFGYRIELGRVRDLSAPQRVVDEQQSTALRESEASQGSE